jgi:hypothetical protein
LNLIEGGVDASTRTLKMKVNMVKFAADRGDYPEVDGHRQTAHLWLKYKGKTCTTSVLPTDIPIIHLNRPQKMTVILDTQGVLGNCWTGLDVSSGNEKMEMHLKLPPNSPIAVSKVQVFDENDTSRCWTSYWRDDPDQNYNKQNNQWVAGKAFRETLYGAIIPELKNNLMTDCTM